MNRKGIWKDKLRGKKDFAPHSTATVTDGWFTRQSVL